MSAPGIGDVTARSTEAMEIIADVETLMRPTEIDHARAETVAVLAMLRVSMVVAPIPEGARPILVDMTMRAYTNQQSVAYETVGPFARQFREAGVYLKDNERADLLALASVANGTAAGGFTIRPGARR